MKDKRSKGKPEKGIQLYEVHDGNLRAGEGDLEKTPSALEWKTGC
jgi:hypothetical protein